MHQLHIPFVVWLLLGALIVLFLVITKIQYFSPDLDKFVKRNKDNLTFVSIDNLIDKVDTGDVIFLTGYTYGEKMMKSGIGSMFSHLCLIVKDVDEESGKIIPYVFEADLGQSVKDGPRVIPLRAKLERYKGSVYGAWRPLLCSDSKRPSSTEVMKSVDKYLDFGMDDMAASWWFSNYPDSWFYNNVAKRKNKVFCAELVAMTLQDVNVLKKNRVGAWYNPEDWYSRVGDLPLSDGYKYGSISFFEMER